MLFDLKEERKEKKNRINKRRFVTIVQAIDLIQKKKKSCFCSFCFILE